MIEIKKFDGRMDTDSGEDFISPASHKYAFNGRFYGTPNGLRFQNIKGNTLIPNANLPTGINKTIGAFYDTLKNRIFYFNYNNAGKNAIYIYDINANTTTTLLMCNSINCPTDILNFNLLDVIVSVNIIYGDSQQGDILYFVDCLFRPTKININRALANGYGTYQRSFLEVIKEPLMFPPVARYEDDNTVTVNNLNGQLFQFKIRWIFDDNDMSVTSAWGVMPLPQGNGDPALSSDPTKNAVIKIIIPTGANNVKKIEILGTNSLGNIWSDFFSIEIITKADLSLPDNDTFIYKFYNNAIYAPIDINESNQLFDYVPQTANTQEVLLTNILIYGGITENFNPVKITSSITSGIDSPADIRFGLLCVQNGNTVSSTDGIIHISLVGKAAIPVSSFDNTLIVNIQTSAGNITYTVIYNSGSIPTTTSIIAALVTSATGLGFTIISSDANNIFIEKTGATLQYFNILNTYEDGTLLNDSIPVYDFSNQATYSIVYFDAQGRSDGVFYTAALTVQTPSYDAEEQPYVQINISNKPPDWAFYYHIVRIANPTKSRLEYWITDRAYPGTDPTTNITYAYLSIENLNQYIKNNPSTATQLGYTWTANDRVKIIENMQSTTIFNTQNDYQIINSLNNPTINGVPYTGQFLQILTPSGASGITIDGTKLNFNFLIEFYTPAKSLAENGNFFYEFGRRYAIGNPTLSTRFHQGEYQNQNTDGSGSAEIKIYDGDAYMRARTIDAGNQLTFTITPGGEMDFDTPPNDNWVLPQTFTQTFQTPEYVVQSVALGIAFTTPNWWLQILQSGLTFNIKGILNFEAVTAFSGTNSIVVAINEDYSGGPTVTTLATFSNVVAGQLLTANIDFTWNPAHNPEFAWFYVNSIVSGGKLKVLGGSLTFIETGSTFSVNIIDQNFSDFYPSQVNSNGRAWAIQPNIQQNHIGTLVRYSLPYDPETTINNVNRFYAQNFDQYQNDGGEIRRLKYRGRFMRVFQERRVGEVPIFQNVLTNTNGQTQIGQSEEVINNIQYYEGEFGIGTQYASLVSGKIQDYFVDPLRGYQVRVSNDGMIPISELYYGQYFIRSLLTPYNAPYTRTDGGSAKILGCYYYFDEEYYCLLQGGTNGSDTIANYLFSFNEKRNGYSSFFAFNNADFILSAEDTIYTWLNGQLYVHNNTDNYTNFYGNQFPLQIQLVFNQQLVEKKSYEAIALLCDTILSAPDIYTNIIEGTQQQQSSLAEANFTVLESMPSANFLRNENNGGLTKGTQLKGNYLVVTLEKTDASNLVNLSVVYIRAIDSPLTPAK